jgi:hypothetical protein
MLTAKVSKGSNRAIYSIILPPDSTLFGIHNPHASELLKKQKKKQICTPKQARMNRDILPTKIFARASQMPDTIIETRVATETFALEASHVYVHCYYNNPGAEMLIRIWRSTFLVDDSSGARAPLVHIENISFAPQWTIVPETKLFHFLLIFEGLPKSCTQFDLLEDIPQTGGFFVEGIQRNKSDVYHIDIA